LSPSFKVMKKRYKKPQAKVTRTSQGSQGSASATMEGRLEGPEQASATMEGRLEGPEQTDFTDTFDQFIYSALSTMAKPDFIQNYGSRQGEGSKSYLVKFAKIGNLHDIMAKIVSTYFPSRGNSSANMKLLLSTILTTLSMALHGLVNPDFIGRLVGKDRTFFLGHGSKRQGTTTDADCEIH
jgi:hypothetical protein